MWVMVLLAAFATVGLRYDDSHAKRARQLALLITVLVVAYEGLRRHLL
jgi:hypothetical protein